jgi:eukaryotic-like serine/threonine-protein kinase
MSSSDQFQRLEQLFHELESLADEQRTRRLHELSQAEPELYPALLRLLENSTRFDQGEQLIDELIDVAGEVAGEAPRDPEQVGPYRLRELIGEGGMGRVYLAEQSEPVRRRVALKLTRRGLDSNDAVARFRAERQALAVLEHPNIARVFDAGSTDGGRPWFAMEYIDGVPITRWAADKGLDLHQRIELLLPVCEAVQHAHAKGLIHRDLKPSNILVIDDGGIGRPMVIDFGIARVVDLSLDERTRATRIGELVGTPEYMSPEQAALGEVDIDTRSDIYTLGLVLYELLVGELPLSGQQLRQLGFQAMCQAIREGDTPRPSRAPPRVADDATLTWRSRLKGDLDSVLLKALAKDRDHRYGTAAALADDLRRYLANEPVLAQPPSLRYRAGKFVRRHRLPVAATGIVALALVASTLIAGFGLIEARNSESRATQELARAEFFLERAETLNRAQGAYADVLRRLTGDSEADLERENRILLERWQEAHENRAINPAQAAALSYAIGTHFAFRRDEERAVAVLEPWIREGYGPKGLLDLASVQLASTYSVLGRREDARALLETLDAEMENGFDRHSASHVQVVQNLAWLGDQGEGFRRAEEVTLAALATEKDPHYVSALWNFLGTARLNLRDRTGATEAYRQAVAVAETDPLADLANLATGRVNLGAMELYFADDPEAAMRQIAMVLGPMRDAIGENSFTGFAHMIQGEAALAKGDVATAVQETGAGLALIEKYVGLEAGSWINAAPAHAAALVASGRTDEARRLVDRLEALLRERGFPLFMAEISRARLEAAAGRHAEAQRLLAQARSHTEGLERGMPHAWRLAQAEAFVAAVRP